MLCGVGLVLVNPDGYVFVLKELQDKPIIEKVAGMLSFPLETVELPETPDETVYRLVREELGDDITIANLSFVGAFHIIRSALTLGYAATCENDLADFRPQSDDVETVGWLHPQDLLQRFIRKETEPILRAFLSRD
jgi:8-oxo-dGTP pyrophosphatase MutT (NUDIX family)